MRHLILSFSFIAALAVCLVFCNAAAALDSIKLSSGKTLSGEITGMTSRAVTLKSLGKTRDVPANEIASITFDDSPDALNLAKLAAGGGRYADAFKTLEAIKPEEIPRQLVKQDVEFYKAMCAARLALAGRMEIVAAGKLMNDFVQSCPQNYHWLEANKLVGDLLVANRAFSRAVGYYEKLSQSPWPDVRMQAQVAIGQAQLAAGETEEARTHFQSALQTGASGQAAERQKLYARIGLARCLVAEHKTQPAVKILEELILATDPEQGRLMAHAYNALGTALRKAGKTNDAILAFLHVDVLYFSASEEHAEALANLSELWNEVHRPQRAAESRRVLQQRYKNSRWATQ